MDEVVMSRQRKWQLKKIAEGKCPKCGEIRVAGACLCPRCLQMQRERQRIKRGSVKVYNSLSRRLNDPERTAVPIAFVDSTC